MRRAADTLYDSALISPFRAAAAEMPALRDAAIFTPFRCFAVFGAHADARRCRYAELMPRHDISLYLLSAIAADDSAAATICRQIYCHATLFAYERHADDIDFTATLLTPCRLIMYAVAVTDTVFSLL